MTGPIKECFMLEKKITGRFFGIAVAVALIVLLAQSAFAAAPVVKTVPWVASNPLIPHDTWSGKSIQLKGTCDRQGASLSWTWDFGDGSPVAIGTVTNMYAIERPTPTRVLPALSTRLP